MGVLKAELKNGSLKIGVLNWASRTKKQPNLFSGLWAKGPSEKLPIQDRVKN